MNLEKNSSWVIFLRKWPTESSDWTHWMSQEWLREKRKQAIFRAPLWKAGPHSCPWHLALTSWSTREWVFLSCHLTRAQLTSRDSLGPRVSWPVFPGFLPPRSLPGHHVLLLHVRCLLRHQHIDRPLMTTLGKHLRLPWPGLCVFSAARPSTRDVTWEHPWPHMRQGCPPWNVSPKRERTCIHFHCYLLCFFFKYSKLRTLSSICQTVVEWMDKPRIDLLSFKTQGDLWGDYYEITRSR